MIQPKATKDVTLEDTAVVILNYKTTEEPAEMLASLKDYYPNIRVIIVDNGSSANVVQQLESIANKYKNVSILPLEENTGFAKGNNAGIKKLREEGYQYICCSNSDIIITEGGVLESLKQALIDTNSALAGPRIKKPNGENHNPIINRPSPHEAKRQYELLNYPNRFKIKNLFSDNSPLLRILPFKKHHLRKIRHKITAEHIIHVYRLRGSFLMMGPLFFMHYDGFDPNTFLYGEERILAEMLLLKKLKTIHVPYTNVKHKECRTLNLVWGKKDKKIKLKHNRNSFNYWYKNYYLKATNNT